MNLKEQIEQSVESTNKNDKILNNFNEDSINNLELNKDKKANNKKIGFTSNNIKNIYLDETQILDKEYYLEIFPNILNPKFNIFPYIC